MLRNVTTESLCLVLQIAEQPITKEETYSVSQSLVLSQIWASKKFRHLKVKIVQVCYCKRHGSLVQEDPFTAKKQPIQLQQASTAASESSEPFEIDLQNESCARAVPFDHRSRRGLRAPEALSAALAKRAFLQACPYQVWRTTLLS